MYPILFSIGPIRIYSYGVMLAAAFLIASYLAGKRAQSFGIPKVFIENLMLVILITGIIGARLFYILANINYFMSYPLESFMIQRGGLIFYGGFIAAFFSALIFIKINKLIPWDIADLLAPFIALAHAIGRIGCFLNGCCYGKLTSSFIGVMFPFTNARVYPVQLFSSAALFIIFLILLRLQPGRKFKGQIFFLYLIIYGTFRFFIEFLRGDQTPLFMRLSAAQIISAVFILAGLLLYLWKRKT